MRILIIVSLLVMCCSKEKQLDPAARKAYEDEINRWHDKRIEEVMAPDGWLNLVGLYWLEPGPNTFGSSQENAIVFPENKIAERAGYFMVDGNSVTIYVNKGTTITTGAMPVEEQLIFHPDSSKLIVLESGSLRWNVIKRDTKLGIRLRDLGTEALTNFKGIERYPVIQEYRTEAQFEPADSSRTINITNVLGQTTAQRSPGALVFKLFGHECHLDVLEGNEEEFFIIFADDTNGNETYGGGRFLYVKMPSENNKVWVDFNKAYNPPCVFTPFATCPLPPSQNQIPFEIKAGEKNFSLSELLNPVSNTSN